MIECVPVDAHVKLELGHISALPGEDHLRGGVINTDDRGAHLVASTHRLPDTRVDVLARAEGGPQRRGPRVRAEDGDSVVDERRVPPPQAPTCVRAGRGDRQSS